MRKEKEEIMTEVITNIKDFIKTEETENNFSTPKINYIFDFLTLKAIAKKSKKEIAKYTEKSKNVRNGKTVLAGTRITTKELMLIIAEESTKPNAIEYILQQYPSIENKDKLLFGALYEINKKNSLLYIARILLNK